MAIYKSSSWLILTVRRPHGLPIFLTALPGRFIGVTTQPELRVLSTFGDHEKGMLSVERSLIGIVTEGKSSLSFWQLIFFVLYFS
ncbi:hypothetical protein [Nostoc sp.]